MVWGFLAAIVLAVWFFGATTFLVLLKTDRTDLSLALWDPDGVLDSIDVAVFEWVLAFSWPLWVGLGTFVVGFVLWVTGRWAVNQLFPARAEQASGPTAPTVRQAKRPAGSKTLKETYREAASNVRRAARTAAESVRERKLRLENVRAERERREADALRALAEQQRTRERVAAQGLRAGVQVRPPKDADDFETVCAEWVKKCGVEADRTKKGPDGGLDLRGPDFAGQCKFHPSNKVGAPDVQQLAGAALGEQKKTKAFFHYGPGYTPAAVEVARKTEVDLWQFDPDAQTFRRISN